jgi:hypothetical protein
LTSKPVATVFSSLTSKLVTAVSSGLVSKPVVRVSRFELQNWQLRFGELGLKITPTVSWFVPQNQADFDLLVAPQNRRSEVGMKHALRSNDLLHVEASRVRVS